MNRRLLLTLILTALWTSPIVAQTREEKVRNDRKKVEAAGYWIYGDLPKALAEAKQSGKPIVAVLRCLPCEECVKLDDELIDADPRLKSLLAQFVRVRIVSTNGLDLSLFQFDTDQSFTVFLFNADGTIYGRFGTRSSRSEWIGDVSIDGLAKALQGALALHQAYPANKSELAAKRGPAPEFTTPEKFPSLASRYKSTLDYQGEVSKSCIHCHQIGDAIRQLSFSRQEKLPETILFPYPHPKSIGLILDPKEMATVMSVNEDSPAEQAGFQAGDAIQKLNGQPLLSMADVQWVLQQTSPDGGTVQANVLRKGKSQKLILKLEAGWRQRDDIAWRASSWELRRVALGGIFSGPLPDEDRQRLKLPADSTALLVKHVGLYPPHNLAHQAGIAKGDIIVGIGSRTDLLRETDVLAERIRKRKPGEKLQISILRNGEPKAVTINFPE